MATRQQARRQLIVCGTHEIDCVVGVGAAGRVRINLGKLIYQGEAGASPAARNEAGASLRGNTVTSTYKYGEPSAAKPLRSFFQIGIASIDSSVMACEFAIFDSINRVRPAAVSRL